MGVQAAYDLIVADMRAIWGDMAPAMLRKRLRDVRANPGSLTRTDLVKIVQLLRERTLPSVMGEEGAEAKANQYLAWVVDGA
ncbi:MAG: hypothetical protein E6K06_04870 [Methanobacteriota archaeon]|nr:MAG: hypothetical protein E6K09_07255 [Euryarchaeota archaeon]TLZ72327.1 MAG: hypothetical protein E6K06_04870 [Euryarchaeota archaeon]